VPVLPANLPFVVLKAPQCSGVIVAIGFMKGKSYMARFISTLKYTRYAMGSLTAVLFLGCSGGS